MSRRGRFWLLASLLAADTLALVAALVGEGHDVAVTGTPGEAELCAEVAVPGARDLSGALDVPQLADAVAHAALVLCGDTGVGHLATATRTRSVPLGWCGSVSRASPPKPSTCRRIRSSSVATTTRLRLERCACSTTR